MEECVKPEERKRYSVGSEDMLELERLFYEYEGLRILVTQFTSDSEFKPDHDRFIEVLRYYLEAYMEYNMLYMNLLHKYVGDNSTYVLYKADFELCCFIEE